MNRKIKTLILFIMISSFIVGCSSTTIREISYIELTDGAKTPCITLSNSYLSVKILPELGGKIISIKSIDGKEFLDRGKPYKSRKSDMTYKDTEFDGIDEIFPTMEECVMPDGELKGLKLHPHGDLYRKKWQYFLYDDEKILMETTGFELPYLFSRSIKLDKNSIILDYCITNKSSQSLPYIYTFHPILRAETGSKVELPPEMKIKVAFSRNGWLGKMGEIRTLSEIRNEDNTLFFEKMFTSNSGRYWKFFTEKLNKGEVIISHPDNTKLIINWPAEKFPYLAVWTSEGNVNGQNHIAPEPSTSQEESLEKAYKIKESRSIKPGSKDEWQIKLTITRK
ncbi:MAG TPA: hypothetical protein P5105_00955 [Victivallales bacterium]|nr:hypothetical protein [Victivallales bacterium]HPO91593.1 hypothetical protein [Victivallales bacterium]HRR05827.1 hypothetical protein [Victivallales bacterium]HRU01227.1 hypothetical protein [Victivallales bacterium]